MGQQTARVAFEHQVDERQQACPHGLRGWHERCASCAIDEAIEELAACCGLCFEHCGAGCRCACHAGQVTERRPVVKLSDMQEREATLPEFAIGLLLGMILASAAWLAAGAGLP